MQEEVPYTQAIVSKFPEQIVIALARDPQGKHNPITLGWTMITSHVPPMMAVSIGKTRYSLEAFQHSREFVIAFPSEHQVEQTMLFGTRSGRAMDKLAESKITTQPARLIDGVLLTEAVANFELRQVGQIETGDHVLFVGQIVCSHLNPARPRRLYTIGEGYEMGGLSRAGQ